MKLNELAKLLGHDTPKQGKIVPLRRSPAEEPSDPEAYRQYQQNILRSGTLQSDIMKGLQAGEPIPALFLKAMEAIGAMTGTEQPKIQARRYLESVYGIALHEPEAARITAQDVQERLEKLEQAQTVNPNDRNIKAAIQRHRAILEQLQ